MGKGDDAGRPALYFHKLGTAQDDDRLVYEITQPPDTHPAGRVTEDGHYLVITQVEGYEKNGVELLDLRKPGAQAQPLFSAGMRSTTSSARAAMSCISRPRTRRRLGRVIAVDAHQPASQRTVVRRGRERARGGDLRRRAHHRQVRGGRAWRRAHLRARRAPGGTVPLPGLGRHRWLSWAKAPQPRPSSRTPTT